MTINRTTHARILSINSLILLFDAYRGFDMNRHSFNPHLDQNMTDLIHRKLIGVKGGTFGTTKSGTNFVELGLALGVDLVQQRVNPEARCHLTSNKAVTLLDCTIEPALHQDLHGPTLSGDLEDLSDYKLIVLNGVTYKPTGLGSVLIDYWKAMSIVP